jgi:UDP-N-acetylglucosamine 2-epimerase (non-hydrolysing)
MPLKILNVAGARPNFMKIAPIMDVMKSPERAATIQARLVHTGQHYDPAMSDVFFKDLGIPEPDIHLGVGSGTHAEQTAMVMTSFEKVCLAERPDLILVVGDVNSTMACTLVGAKLQIPVAHVEAGLRSFDRTMPEEVNRLVTDALADLLFTTSRDANDNLLREGIPGDKIHFVGNVMIDTLLRHREKALALGTLSQFGLSRRQYALVTLHRPSNVDHAATFGEILTTLRKISESLPVVFAIHPRSRKRIAEFALDAGGLNLIDPLGYLDFLNLTANARMVLTDSGGLQEETPILGVPCLTLRNNTERPVTISQGTNTLVGPNPDQIIAASRRVLANGSRPIGAPELWDGQAARRIVDIIEKKCPSFSRTPRESQ